MKNKEGISLIVLVITIIVSIIIVSATVVGIGNSIENTKIVTFANDLSAVEEHTETYYIQNNDFPIKEETIALSEAQILALAGEQNSLKLKEELVLNGDKQNNENLGAYYKIDLAKIGVEQTARGTSNDINSNDVYVVSYPSLNVYYLQGVKAKGDTYFSLSSKLTSMTKIQKPAGDDTSVTTVQTIANITAKKTTKTWTNIMGITIGAVLESGEDLYLGLPNGSVKKFTTTVGMNNFTIDYIYSTNDSHNSANKVVPEITEEDKTTFEALTQTQKYVEIIKRRGSVEVGKIRLDMSNYDSTYPVISGDVTTSSKETNNTIKFTVNDIVSGIKEIRYEYLKKYNEKGDIVNYYDNVTSFDTSYMKSRGKKANISKEGYVEIQVPKNMEGIQILILDKAGNGVNVTRTISTDIFYAGVELEEMTNDGAKFSLVFNSANGIKSANVQVSTDGINFSNAVTYNINTADRISTKLIEDFTTIANMKSEIYVKVVATDNNNKTETNIVTLKSSNISNDDSTVSTWDKPYIPPEFTYKEGTVDTGYVIIDKTNGNEFVWVPVKSEAEYKRGVIGDTTNINGTPSSGYYENDADATNIAIKASILKHGGFYIGRYETGLNEEATYSTTVTDGTIWQNATPVVKKDARPWNYISQIKAIEVSKNMYTETTKSALINSYIWDTTLNWIISSNAKTGSEVVTNSSTWGNYKNATFTFDNGAKYSTDLNKYLTNNKNKSENIAWLLTTGAIARNSVNNIYDMAGNLMELTTEVYDSVSRTNRGGNFDCNGNDYPAPRRSTIMPGNFSGGIGFRILLYL